MDKKKSTSQPLEGLLDYLKEAENSFKMELELLMEKNEYNVWNLDPVISPTFGI